MKSERSCVLFSTYASPLIAVREVEEKEGVCWRVDEHGAPSKPKLQATRSSGLNQSNLSKAKSHPNLTVLQPPNASYCKTLPSLSLSMRKAKRENSQGVQNRQVSGKLVVLEMQ